MDRSKAQILVEMEIRVSLGDDGKFVTAVLDFLRGRNATVKAHILYRLGEQTVCLLVVENAEETALALQKAEMQVELETVVTVTAARRPGMLAQLMKTLTAEGIAVGYSYSAVVGDCITVVLRTDDNPKAQDVLRNLLILAEDDRYDS